MGQEFYLYTLRDGAVIFAPYSNTEVNVDGTSRILKADGYWQLPGGAYQHIVSDKPIVIQTLGRANSFNDMGTFLGGRSAIKHYYKAAGTYTLGLTVYDKAGLSHKKTTTVSVGASNPPVADHGGPYVADERLATGGSWKVNLDATRSTDDYSIFKYEWDFDASNGIQVDATGPAPTAAYTKTGTYTVTLRVYDQALQRTEVTTTATILANAPPLADAGGPYLLGEEAAGYGTWTVQLDGSGSRDETAIYRYNWLLSPIIYDFAGNTLDTNEWYGTTGVTQNNGLTLVGANSWSNQYLGHSGFLERAEGVTFQARLLPGNTAGNQHAMFGFKNLNGDHSYTQFTYAIYFNNGSLYVYEGGTSRGAFGNYIRNTLYDIRIVLKETGAGYYYKPATAATWSLLYDSAYSAATPLKLAATINSGTFKLPGLSVIKGAMGINPDFELYKAGNYNLTLTVYDHALQSSTDSTTILIADGQAPVAHAGGPYTTGVGSMLLFNGTASTNDKGIETYEWTFGDTTGAPAELPYTGKGTTPEHFYRQEGTYTVTLKVTDHTGKADTATTTVTVVGSHPPVAQTGGPYLAGAGGPPAYFDASGSHDDFGIIEYRWDTDASEDSDGDGNYTNDINVTGRKPFYVYPTATGTYFTENFTGATINSDKWLVSGAVQNDKLSLAGANAWGNRYVFSQANYRGGNGLVIQGQVQASSAAGNQAMMWGVKDTSTNYNYQQLPGAIYFNNGYFQIYEKGAYRGQFGTYTRGLLYDVKIELKANGPVYYSKPATESNWVTLYTSAVKIESAFRVGAVVNTGTFDFDNFSAKGPDDVTVTLTVEDGAGQVSTAQTKVTVAANLPPHVITIPWVAHDPSIPHEVHNGKAIHLKGIVRDADPLTYQWNFGDGTSSAVLNVTNSFDLSVIHTYPDAQPGTPFVATLTAWDSQGLSAVDTYNLVVRNKSLSVETNITIDEGLWYLHTQQTRTTTNNYPAGWWRTFAYGNYQASATAAALQAFEINGHLEGGDHQENPYAETVARGLKYLFTKISSYPIADQTYGKPDTNGNGLGVGVNESYPIYQGGPVMDAIASSQSPLTRTVTGGTGINRRSYFEILNDMVDMFAWGQDDNSNGGGWRYNWNDYPDNSAAQWGAIGLQAAEDIFGIPIPPWVKERNNNWLDTSYDNTGFGYGGPGNGVATTPSGMVQLAFDDKTTKDMRWQSAENDLASRWALNNNTSVIYRWKDGNNENTRNYYAMYAFTKAMRLANPKPVVTFKANGFDWYHDPVLGMARSVIDDQLTDGRISGTHYSDRHMRTAWGVIILSQTLFVQPPVAVAGGPYQGTAGLPVTLDGSGSFEIDPFDSIFRYEWELDNVFPYGFDEATGAKPAYIWQTPGMYNLGLQVWDDGVMNDLDNDGQVDENERLSDQSFTTITIVANEAPVAEAGGPYAVNEGAAVTLDGSLSHDPNGDLLIYSWDLDNDGEYNDANGPQVSHTFMDNGTYTVGLRVTDTLLSNTDTAVVVVGDLAPQAAFTWTPATQSEGSAVNFSDRSTSAPDKIVQWRWDFGGKGNSSYQAPSFTFNDNGTYAVTLQVTDEDGSTDTFTQQLTITNVAPDVEAGNDQTGGTGLALNFYGSYVDVGSLDTHTLTWEFGDGSSVSGNLTPTHVYTNKGSYTVYLTVTDDDGGIGKDSLLITVNESNHPPVADAGPGQIAEATSGDGATVRLDGSGSTDIDLDPLVYTWTGSFGTAGGINADVILPLGQHLIHLKVSDGKAEATDSVTMAVRDTIPPVLVVPVDKTVQAAGVRTSVNIGQAQATDIFDVTITNDAPVDYPVGTTAVTWRAVDSNGNESSAVQRIHVINPARKKTVTVRLVDSNGNGLPGGLASYYKDTWSDIGITDANGNTQIELEVGLYKFGMKYLGTTNIKSVYISNDQVVVFATKRVDIKLIDSTGQGLPGGSADVYDTKWNPIGTTDTNGSTGIELLTGLYKFRMGYLGMTNYKSVYISTNQTVIFLTKKVEVRLLDSNGNGLAGGLVRFYSGSWRDLGPTDSKGSVYIELLTGGYTFSMEYERLLKLRSVYISSHQIIVFNW